MLARKLFFDVAALTASKRLNATLNRDAFPSVNATVLSAYDVITQATQSDAWRKLQASQGQVRVSQVTMFGHAPTAAPTTPGFKPKGPGQST